LADVFFWGGGGGLLRLELSCIWVNMVFFQSQCHHVMFCSASTEVMTVSCWKDASL